MNREAWLNAVAAEFAPDFEKYGKPLPEKMRIGVGFCTTKRAIGQCHYPANSEDETTEIFIHPGRAEPEDVAQILLHECCHAALGPGFGHGKEFKAIATHMGLEGKMTATTAGPVAQEKIKRALAEAGEYPHAKLYSGSTADSPKPQKGKGFLNFRCPNKECDFEAKIRRDHVSYGQVMCPACDIPLKHKAR